MAAAGDLTRGAVAAISEEEAAAAALRPVLQVVDVRLVSTAQSTSERYRMVLSDGAHSQQAMLATSMNALVRDGRLRRGTLVQLNEFICNTIQNRRIIIVINLEVLQTECEMIGSPKLYDLKKSSSPGQALGVNSAANDPQSYGGSNSGGQGMMGGSSIAPKTEHGANNPPYGGSYGPMSARNTSNVNMLQSKPEQSPGNFNQNQRFAVPASGGAFRPPGNTYGRPAQPSYQQPPPMYMNRGPIAKNEAPARIVPIAALNPYQGRWTIKARVTAKADLRHYNNPRGEGKVFSFDLLDADGGEIRATCFNAVADQFFDQIEVGRVYLISRGHVKPAQKEFNHLNSDYEITLDSSTSIQPCSDEDNSIPKQQFNFRLINEVENMENNSMVDLIGVVTSISPAATIMRKNGTETQKRTLQLKDMSGRSVEITFWGNYCNVEGQQLQSMCDSGVHPVLALKAGRVSDFSGKSVGTISSTQLVINPDFPEAERLKEWYISEGKTAACIPLSREMSSMGRTDVRKTVAQIKDENLGRSEKPDWITVKATISFIKPENFCYTACPLMVGDRQCNKKVNNNGDGRWHCDRCDQSFPECDYRYLLQFQIQDHTGITWVTAFQEAGEEIMGHTAKELHLLKYEEQDDVRFADIIQGILFGEYLFKLKVKEETFSDEQRVKSTVVKAEKVNPSSESRYLLGFIDKLLLEDSGSAPEMQGAMASNTGFGNMETRPGMQPANSNYGSSIGGARYGDSANQLGLQVNEYGGISNLLSASRNVQACNICGTSGHNAQNCPANMNRQDQSAGGGFASRSFGTSVGGGNTPSGVCFKCQQPGHWARDCPGLATGAPTYGNAGVSGGYNRQSYVGGY